LINRENYFVFQPLLAEVVSGNIGMLDTVSAIRSLLPKTDLHVRKLRPSILKTKTITTASGFRPVPHTVEYDHLVLALAMSRIFAD